MTEVAGQCRCGAVSYSSPGPVLWAGHCHCDSCRRATSAPFTSFFGVPRVSVEWSGDLAWSDSANGAVTRGFCRKCGSQLTYQSEHWPDEAHLYAATLGEPAQFSPMAHFHWAERLPWIAIADELPKYAGSADAADPL